MYIPYIDIISGAPRHDGRRLFGSVRVRTQANRHGSTSIELLGSQVSCAYTIC